MSYLAALWPDPRPISDPNRFPKSEFIVNVLPLNPIPRVWVPFKTVDDAEAYRVYQQTRKSFVEPGVGRVYVFHEIYG